VVLLCFFFFFAECSKKKNSFEFPVSDLAEGDIVFRRGIGTKTRAVLHADKEGIYSHVGIVVEADSGFMIVHISPGEREEGQTEDLIKMESPDVFFGSDRASKGAVLRFKDSTEITCLAALYAIELSKQHILFDEDYNLNDSTNMYCSELLWRIYKHAGRDVTQGRRSELKDVPVFSGIYIFPSDIYKNDHLEIIYQY
jgi:hypothetical protein